MTRNRSLFLGVGVGLFGALAILTVHYVAIVLVLSEGETMIHRRRCFPFGRQFHARTRT